MRSYAKEIVRHRQVYHCESCNSSGEGTRASLGRSPEPPAACQFLLRFFFATQVEQHLSAHVVRVGARRDRAFSAASALRQRRRIFLPPLINLGQPQHAHWPAADRGAAPPDNSSPRCCRPASASRLPRVARNSGPDPAPPQRPSETLPGLAHNSAFLRYAIPRLKWTKGSLGFALAGCLKFAQWPDHTPRDSDDIFRRRDGIPVSHFRS